MDEYELYLIKESMELSELEKLVAIDMYFNGFNFEIESHINDYWMERL